MCLSPILIDNPNRNAFSQRSKFSSVTDTTSYKIAVPCGRCASCLALKQNYYVQRVQMEALDNVILYGMLSYNNHSLPSIDVNGYNIKYASVRHFQDMIRLMRKDGVLPDCRYFACSERGGKKHRPHWHFMCFIPISSITDSRLTTWHLESLQAQYWPLFLKYWRHNVGSRKFPIWLPNCTYKQRGFKRNYDLQVIDTISGDSSDAAFYITKYSTKFDDYSDRLKSALYFNLPESDFHDTWNLVKPHYLMSKGFGNPDSDNVRTYINTCIQRSIDDPSCFYPTYYSPYSGQGFPLSPYYRKKFLTADQALVFKNRILAASPTDVISDAELGIVLSPDQIDRKIADFERRKKMIAARDSDCEDLLDFQGLCDNNISDFLLTDVDYGKIVRLNQEDFESSEAW